MHADQLLVEDHDRIRGLLQQLRTPGLGVGDRRRLLNALIDELVVHVHLEDELFYPAVRAVSPMVAVALAEHRQIDDHLAATLRADPASARFDEEMAALAASIEGHAREEDREMFPQSHALGDAALEALGARMKARQDQLQRSKLVQLHIAAKRALLRRTGGRRKVTGASS